MPRPGPRPPMASMPEWLRRGGRWLWLAAEIAVLSGLILVTRCANYTDVFVGGKIYFVDADCYARMTRARLVAEHPGLIVRHHDFENYPAGTTPHTTAPLDYLVVGLGAILAPFSLQALDLAGALISPLLGLLAGWFLWWWGRHMGLPYRWAGLLIFALSPILAHGTALGRPDHQALLVLLVLVALAAEWSLGRKLSHAWNVVAGLAWGLALWVSPYEPLVLLVVVSLCARSRFLIRSRQAAFWSVFLLAALIERRWPQWPMAELRTSYSHWSATIGELSPVGLTNPLWWHWFGGCVVVAPILLFLAWKRRALETFMCALLPLTLALTVWQARWAYFFGAVLALAIPALFTLVRPRWLGALLALLAFLPFLQIWDEKLWPNEQQQTQRAEARREAVEWRAAATTMAGSTRTPFLAPWWLSPSAAYWSGQPAIAGSSHESLPGILESARFFLSTGPREARTILERREVTRVLAYDGARTAQNVAAILNVPIPQRPLCLTLDRLPSQAPAFLFLAGENGAAKLFEVRDLREK